LRLPLPHATQSRTTHRMRAASATANPRLFLCSLVVALLISGCFFRVPTGTRSFHSVLGIRIDPATANVVQLFMQKKTAVDEFALMDPDGGGRYLRDSKESYYIQKNDHTRIKFKTLETFTHDPPLAAQFFLPPGLVTTNTLARMLVPGTSGGFLFRRITDGQGHYFTNATSIAINFSAYHRTDRPPHLKVYVLDNYDTIVRARELPLAAPETPTTLYPDLRLDSTRQHLTYKTPEGYMTYGTVTDRVVPAHHPLPERILPANTDPPPTP
jgi:hypothetical protein